MMYLTHFGLSEAPFGLTPDTAYTVDTRSHQEAFNTLLVAVAGGEGFIKVAGEIGTGKTLLCRRFLSALADASADEGWVTCYLPNPRMTPRDLLLALAAEIGLKLPSRTNEFGVHQAVGDRLLTLGRQGRRVVLCIDEAQALTVHGLETLRLLSNLETEKRKLLQLVLFGQPELDQTLALTSMRQLRQRIASSYRLGAIDRAELPRYLDHRLHVAGHTGASLFAPAAVAGIHHASAGTPRLVNILAHKALLSAFGAGAAGVGRKDVRAAIKDTPSVCATADWFGWLA